MPNPIPDFDLNLVLPPHLGNPTVHGQLSPYPCTTVDLCQRFGTTPERRAILGGFLDFRKRLQEEGLTTGFQWLDGSFLEDVERREGRSPRDLDVVTIYWGYDDAFLNRIGANFPEFADPDLAHAAFLVHHFAYDGNLTRKGRPCVEAIIDMTRYWALLFSHNRNRVWKGMLKVELDTPDLDRAARLELNQPNL